ncbi:MAG: helix-turn-helix domain-containing protein [Chloroflexi bacterium]|nr:helix-turn-helix domain-containing protein [Chloroflexota bacterium]
MKEFGARLRELRKLTGLSQRELAQKVGVSFTYLSKLENGTMPPPSDRIMFSLAEALGADKDELMTLAGRIPPDILELLKDKETLKLLRASQMKKKARSTHNKEGVTDMVKKLFYHNRFARVALAFTLVVAVASSLWFATPTRALTVEFPSLPATGTIGNTYTFQVKVNIENNEVLPVQSVSLRIFNTNPTLSDIYYDQYTGLPLATGASTLYTGTASTALISATADSNWGYGYGYGYANWNHQGSRGYGYGYGYLGATAITYNLVWTAPSGWAEGNYKVEVAISAAGGQTFTQLSNQFLLSRAASSGVGGVTPTTSVINSEGVFTQTVIARSEDGMAELLIPQNTVGKTSSGSPLSQITVFRATAPPTKPANSEIIGWVYDFLPDGATFSPPITLTVSYDPALLPAGVDEKNLVLAYYDSAVGKWVNLTSTVDTASRTISAKISHFTAFTVVAYTRPAAFTVSSLTVMPSEVGIGEAVGVSVTITNTGDLKDTYKVVLKVNDTVAESRDITLAGGASEKVSFLTQKNAAGVYNVDVNGQTGKFTVKAGPVLPKPAAFATSGLTITPAEAKVGETVTISVTVANTGGQTGTYKVTLKVNNVTVTTQDVVLSGGASQKVTFTTKRDVAGTYTASIDSLSGTFTVKAATVTPPTPTPKPATNWVLILGILGIIVGVLVIGVVIWFFVKRRPTQ